MCRIPPLRAAQPEARENTRGRPRKARKYKKTKGTFGTYYHFSIPERGGVLLGVC